MFDSHLPGMNPEVEPLLPADPRWSPAGWRGFLAGLFNWYILAKTILIYRSELWLSVTGSSFCGTCAAYADDQVYFVAAMWIGVGIVLWMRVRTVAPSWAGFAKWPIRLAFLGWVSVVLAAIGATVLSFTPPFAHRM